MNAPRDPLLDALLTSSADCIKILDLHGRVTFMNEGGLKLMQIPDLPAIQGCSWPDMWQSERRADVKAAIEAALAGGVGQFQGPAPTFAGEWRYWSVQVTPIRGTDGVVAQLLAVSRDMTEARDSALKAQRLAGLVEQSQDMIVVADREARVIFINQAGLDLLGLESIEAARAVPGLSHLAPEEIGRAVAEITPGLLRAGSWSGEVRLRHAQTRAALPVVLSAFTLRGENGAIVGYGAIARDPAKTRESDPAARKLLDAARLEAEAALRQGLKMEALGQLTGGIAHDFNNLLTGIIGSLDILRRRLASGRPENAGRYIEAASGSAQRAAALTQQLLAFARRQSLDNKPADIAGLLRGMEAKLRATLGESVGLRTIIAADLWPALTDARQLETSIMHLALNARDAMPGGGQLTIELANAKLEAAQLCLTDDLAPGDYVAITVSDNGTGMAPDVLDQAFDPFFTTKPVGEGTGLGLSMIYGFAKQSGGQARIDSKLGAGTRIKLFLPRAPATPRHDQASGVSAGRGETVLVVEDDPTVRLLMVDVLQELGYRHVEAPDGQLAVPILHSKQRIDLMVTDVGLPHINGRQLAEIARAARPGLRVLFVTGYAERAAVRHGFLEPGMDLLTKPFALDDLATKVREMIEG